jgi:hypothetical protein
VVLLTFGDEVTDGFQFVVLALSVVLAGKALRNRLKRTKPANARINETLLTPSGAVLIASGVVVAAAARILQSLLLFSDMDAEVFLPLGVLLVALGLLQAPMGGSATTPPAAHPPRDRTESDP